MSFSEVSTLSILAVDVKRRLWSLPLPSPSGDPSGRRTLLPSFRVILTTSPVAVSRIANGCSRARSSSAWYRHLSDNAGQGSAKPRTTVTVVNVAQFRGGLRRKISTGVESDGGRDTRGTARTPDAQCKHLDMIWVSERAPSCSRGHAGAGPIINVALAKKSAGSPARD